LQAGGQRDVSCVKTTLVQTPTSGKTAGVTPEKDDELKRIISQTLQLWSLENGALGALYRADDAKNAARDKYERLLKSHASSNQVREIAARAIVALHELELNFFALTRALISRGVISAEDLQKGRDEVDGLSDLYRATPGQPKS
jgi:hypothetical protein